MTVDILALIDSSDWGALSDLLDRNPKIACYVDDFGNSLLMYLAGKVGSADLIKKSIILGANPNHSALDGSNAISKAINHGNGFGLDAVEELKVLIKMGADPNLIADAGYPALHWAIVQNKPNHLRVLVDFGADTKAKTSDFPSETLMQVAERVGSLEIIDFLNSRRIY
jgi:ankyrin repeat protein